MKWVLVHGAGCGTRCAAATVDEVLECIDTVRSSECALELIRTDVYLAVDDCEYSAADRFWPVPLNLTVGAAFSTLQVNLKATSDSALETACASTLEFFLASPLDTDVPDGTTVSTTSGEITVPSTPGVDTTTDELWNVRHPASGSYIDEFVCGRNALPPAHIATTDFLQYNLIGNGLFVPRATVVIPDVESRLLLRGHQICADVDFENITVVTFYSNVGRDAAYPLVAATTMLLATLLAFLF